MDKRISSGKRPYQQVDHLFAIHRILVAGRGLHFLMQCRFLLVFGTQPADASVNQEMQIGASLTLRK